MSSFTLLTSAANNINFSYFSTNFSIFQNVNSYITKVRRIAYDSLQNIPHENVHIFIEFSILGDASGIVCYAVCGIIVKVGTFLKTIHFGILKNINKIDIDIAPEKKLKESKVANFQ